MQEAGLAPPPSRRWAGPAALSQNCCGARPGPHPLGSGCECEWMCVGAQMRVHSWVHNSVCTEALGEHVGVRERERVRTWCALQKPRARRWHRPPSSSCPAWHPFPLGVRLLPGQEGTSKWMGTETKPGRPGRCR